MFALEEEWWLLRSRRILRDRCLPPTDVTAALTAACAAAESQATTLAQLHGTPEEWTSQYLAEAAHQGTRRYLRPQRDHLAGWGYLWLSGAGMVAFVAAVSSCLIWGPFHTVPVATMLTSLGLPAVAVTLLVCEYRIAPRTPRPRSITKTLCYVPAGLAIWTAFWLSIRNLHLPFIPNVQLPVLCYLPVAFLMVLVLKFETWAYRTDWPTPEATQRSTHDDAWREQTLRLLVHCVQLTPRQAHDGLTQLTTTATEHGRGVADMWGTPSQAAAWYESNTHRCGKAPGLRDLIRQDFDQVINDHARFATETLRPHQMIRTWPRIVAGCISVVLFWAMCFWASTGPWTLNRLDAPLPPQTAFVIAVAVATLTITTLLLNLITMYLSTTQRNVLTVLGCIGIAAVLGCAWWGFTFFGAPLADRLIPAWAVLLGWGVPLLERLTRREYIFYAVWQAEDIPNALWRRRLRELMYHQWGYTPEQIDEALNVAEYYVGDDEYGHVLGSPADFLHQVPANDLTFPIAPPGHRCPDYVNRRDFVPKVAVLLLTGTLATAQLVVAVTSSSGPGHVLLAAVVLATTIWFGCVGASPLPEVQRARKKRTAPQLGP